MLITAALFFTLRSPCSLVIQVKYIMDDILERLSARSVYVTDAYQDFHNWITELEEASTCDESEFSAEQFEKLGKPTKKVMSKLLYSVYREMKLFVREAIKMFKKMWRS